MPSDPVAECLEVIRAEACKSADALGGDVNFIERGILEREYGAALRREAALQAERDALKAAAIGAIEAVYQHCYSGDYDSPRRTEALHIARDILNAALAPGGPSPEAEG